MQTINLETFLQHFCKTQNKCQLWKFNFKVEKEERKKIFVLAQLDGLTRAIKQILHIINSFSLLYRTLSFIIGIMFCVLHIGRVHVIYEHIFGLKLV